MRLLAALPFVLAPFALADDAVPTWHQDVAAIFQKRCQTCHRAGQSGPFSLVTKEEVAEYKDQIAEVVRERRMPPWHADPTVGHFANSRRLEDAEHAALMKWLEGGMPEGDASKPTPPVEWPLTRWTIGQPDAVIAIPQKVKIPASGVLEYKYFEVPTDFMEDKWIDAVEVRASAPEVVHHVLVFVKYPDGSHKRMQGGLRGFFASGLPGDSVLPFPAGTAKRFPRGTSIIFQLHYTPNGTAAEDLTEIALKFAPAGTARRELKPESIFHTDFRIPPHAKAHEVTAKHTFKEDVLLFSLLPHMHLRGKAFKYTLKEPDGREEVILNVPAYDFNWQNAYRLAVPRFIPKGSVMTGLAVYDNSEGNPANPDPSRDVGFGEQTWDEMMIGYMDVAAATAEERAAWEAERAPK